MLVEMIKKCFLLIKKFIEIFIETLSNLNRCKSNRIYVVNEKRKECEICLNRSKQKEKCILISSKCLEDADVILHYKQVSDYFKTFLIQMFKCDFLPNRLVSCLRSVKNRTTMSSVCINGM